MIQTLFGSVPQEPNLLDRLKAGIEKTRTGLVDRLEEAIAGRKEIDADLLDELEFALITADIGVNTTSEILESIQGLTPADLEAAWGYYAQHRAEIEETIRADREA